MVLHRHELVHVLSPQKSFILRLDVVGEDLNRKILHPVLPLVALVLTFDHEVECLKEQGVEIILDSLFVLVLPECLKFIGSHSYKS